MILLSRDGVFPRQKDTKPHSKYSTGFSFPGTIQGEGKWAGTPSLFVRLQGCNLRCVWSAKDSSPCLCDTAYASFASNAEAQRASADEISDIICQNAASNIRHVVITGGEPLLQAAELLPLMNLLHSHGFIITIETNGTLFSPAVKSVVEKCHLLSISPKLSSSIPIQQVQDAIRINGNIDWEKHRLTVLNRQPLHQLVQCAQESDIELQLKFVINSHSDEEEINGILEKTSNVSPSDVLLMPMGTTTEDMQDNGRLAAEIAVKHGWRFTPRLQIMLWGSKENV